MKLIIVAGIIPTRKCLLAFYFPSHVGFQFAPVDVKLLGTQVPLSPLLGLKLSTSSFYYIYFTKFRIMF